ncbi:unnamed protein product [Notodromas monacha]|uniref:Uncharacterized protein n=1 Tax=Notodromas monacha TaxID=399045 RepID=A0A7R9BY78_9CRUS|nr:unnamed protein product [Notodromas monacha]CAG0922861.1 unnamed protein product [Notodromas monacha]
MLTTLEPQVLVIGMSLTSYIFAWGLDKVYKTGIIDKCFSLEYIRGSYKTLSSDSFNFAVKDIHAGKIVLIQYFYREQSGVDSAFGQSLVR